jgi:hypothetical protein
MRGSLRVAVFVCAAGAAAPAEWAGDGAWSRQAAGVRAAPNQLLRFAGTLRGPGGDPLEGDHVLVFEIFDGARGGAPLWKEKHEVTLEEGSYTVLLGSVSRIRLPLDRDSYLFVHPEGLDEVLEEYRIAVPVEEPGAGPDATAGARGVYRLEAVGRKRGSREAARVREGDEDASSRTGKAGGRAAGGDREVLPEPEPPVDLGPEPGETGTSAVKLRAVKQIRSPSGTLSVAPSGGTPNPLELPGTG